MTAFWASSPSSSQNPSAYSKDDTDIADTGLADVGLPLASPQAPGPSTSIRPQLIRNQLQPPPTHQPPPPPAPQQAGNATDSLSLMQLRRIVTEFPRTEIQAYAFTYADTATYEEEIDEWFSYNEAEFLRLRRAKNTFERRWKKFHNMSWMECDLEMQKIFIKREISDLRSPDIHRRCKSLQTILHVVLGVWHKSAGIKGSPGDLNKGDEEKSKTTATKSQLKAIKSGVLLITEWGGVPEVFEVLRNALDRLWGDEYRESKVPETEIHLMQDELDNVTTILYLLIETTRHDLKGLAATQKELASLNPSLVDYLLTATAKLRWDDANELPQTRIFLLFWKAVLLLFGGTAEIEEAKQATSEWTSQEDSHDIITASPLDYHIFRQEITSKYPAYIPPPPLLPLDLNTNTILPPLPNHPYRNTGANGILPTPASANSAGGSILHQPVHIATPAPSPPPSPPVGGKAGKKQNYQTNQNFPFMYPPLDSTSNSAGGKGTAGLQELLVGRKWEGSDIPASILEAGELFAKRTKMTRAMRQLWDERERFLKFERGWDNSSKLLDIDDTDIEEIDLDNIDGVAPEEPKIKKTKVLELEGDYGPRPLEDAKIKARIDAIERFYRTSLPQLQSLVIVLLKAVLANVTALIIQPMASQPHPGSYQSEVNLRANGVQGQRRPGQDNTAPPVPTTIDVSDLPIDELEALRSREITAKAVSGILLILLKWFKVSHILKFEYFTQLLLDSNYLPLVLKLFAHQEIDRVVDSNADREDLSFFTFCNANNSITSDIENGITSDDDDAIPPPIKLSRDETLAERAKGKQPASLQNKPRVPIPKREPPEIDELGYPVNEPLSEPKTDFSWRNFFSCINYLRVMQKICKNKAHRNLLLVQYKSSNILKKALKVPQQELRLYTLKLFKNQVPYCGRKWRQGNMRVITAVYLHCRPELRDDWLAGSDVDAEVEEALPLEQALRALTHWHNIKRYPDQMGADVQLLEEEHDFFVRELEKLDFSAVDGDVEESVAEIAWDGQVNGW